MNAVDDGIWQGNLNLADIFFLISAILFGIAAFFAWSVQPRVIWPSLVAAGLCLVSLGWLVL